MSGETLRRAAALMRERAQASTAGPWVSLRRGRVGRHLAPALVESVAHCYPEGGSSKQQAVVDHIASWHPAVALAMADLLDVNAATVPLCDAPNCDNCQTALAVARAYLGESG